MRGNLNSVIRRNRLLLALLAAAGLTLAGCQGAPPEAAAPEAAVEDAMADAAPPPQPDLETETDAAEESAAPAEEIREAETESPTPGGGEAAPPPVVAAPAAPAYAPPPPPPPPSPRPAPPPSSPPPQNDATGPVPLAPGASAPAPRPEPMTTETAEDAPVRAVAPGAAARIGAVRGMSGSSAAPSLPPFPWPPPEPSARELIPRRDLLRGATAVSQGEIGRRIEQSLRQAGYTEYSYYSAPGGFALVARLERMRPDGTPEPSSFRFLAPNADEPFSLTSYISRLFFAPEGFYRQIVFVATDKPFVASAPAPTAAEAQRLLREGGNKLPVEYDSRPFGQAHSVTALIYEFKKNPADRDVETLQPGRLAGAEHLAKAGIRFGGGP